MKRKPSILDQQPLENGVLLTLKVDGDIVDFEGHFPGYPLLPGVTQIDWAYHYGRTVLNTPEIFQGMEVIKFFKPIAPNSTVELRLCWRNEKKKLEFTFQSPEGKHSSGRILLVEKV